MKEKLTLRKVSWGVTLSVGSTLFTAICACIWFFFQNQNLKQTVKERGDTIEMLKESVHTLNGSVSTMDRAVDAFMENPPSSLQRQIDEVNRRIDRFHLGSGHQPSEARPPDTFANVQPPSR